MHMISYVQDSIKRLHNSAIEFFDAATETDAVSSTAKESVSQEVAFLNQKKRWRANDFGQDEKRVQELEEQANSLKLEVQRVGNELAAIRQRNLKLEEDLMETENQANKLGRKNQSLKRQQQQTNALLDEEKRAHHQTMRQLETRTQEWHGAQAFLVTSDTVSGADVTNLVNQLNEEIFQISAIMAESIASFSPGSSPPDAVMHGEASRIVGVQITELLSRRDSVDDSSEIIIQNALQSVLTGYCVRQINTIFSIVPENDNYLTQVYESIRQTGAWFSLDTDYLYFWLSELPAVSGRWRALTRAKTKGELPEDALVEEFIHWIAVVLKVYSDQDWLQALTAEFSEKFIPVARMVKRLDKVIGEVTSQDLRVFLPQTGQPFNNQSMIDANEVPRRAKRSRVQSSGTVVCAVSMGLHCESWKTINGQFQIQSNVLLRAKVVLDTDAVR